MVDALVLAGSNNDGPLRECSPAPFEALIPIGKKLMVEYVVDALRAVGCVKDIVVVGPVQELKCVEGPGIILEPNRGSVMENVLAGCRRLSGKRKVLLATCDIPLITPIAIEDFIGLCRQSGAELCYPVISRDVVEKKYAYVRRTYVTLKEGQFTGGNLFFFDPKVVERCLIKGQQLVNARKSPFKLSGLLGFTFLVKFLLHLITLREAEKKASQLLGVKGAVIISGFPEVGVDVDKPSDLELVSKTLNV